MRDYDEKFFLAKANKRAGTTWLLLMIIVSIFYGAKVAANDVKLSFFIVFSVVGCRMPADSKEIKEYVSQNYSE